MKATELMIGDWVYNSYHKKNIKWSYSEMFCPNGIPVIGRDLEPIPLTPEILDKNGFYDRNTQWYYKRFGSYVCFDIAISLIYREIEVSKVCGAGTDCEEEEYGSSIVFGNDICVHELQHALRLCGLNELADNFKI